MQGTRVGRVLSSLVASAVLVACPSPDHRDEGPPPPERAPAKVLSDALLREARSGRVEVDELLRRHEATEEDLLEASLRLLDRTEAIEQPVKLTFEGVRETGVFGNAASLGRRLALAIVVPTRAIALSLEPETAKLAFREAFEWRQLDTEARADALEAAIPGSKAEYVAACLTLLEAPTPLSRSRLRGPRIELEGPVVSHGAYHGMVIELRGGVGHTVVMNE